jgi:hypothetical protein
MLPRPAAGALLASALVLAGTARAEPTASRGAVVVSIGDDATPAARPLALEVYRDASLRPAVDDATARVLAGEAPPETASPRLKDLAALRASLAHPATGDGADPAASDLVTRRLLAGVGTDAHATLVVAVTMQAGRPTARALAVASSSWQGVEIGATATAAADGSTAFTWPGAVTTLRALVPKEAAAPAPAPRPKAAPPRAAPTKESPERAKDRSFWTSPWFWVGLGAVVATGVTVFVVTKAVQDDSGSIHVDGRVPR